MRIFVTGGAGFIGSNFVRNALAQGNEVTVFDALTYAGHLSTLSDVKDHSGFRFVQGDIRDTAAVAAAIADHKTMVHFAAETHVDRSITGPHTFIETNCVGTSVVMRAALEAEVERVIHISTDETYGSIDEGEFSETDRLEPRSPYSASKAGSDQIALSYFTTYGLPVTVTRSSNQFGPFQYPEKLIPLFVTNLLEGKRVGIYGDGLNIRDWLYVDDNVAAVNTVLHHGKPGEVYNIGTGAEITNVEITRRLLELCDADQSSVDYIEDRLGHDRRYAIDTTKIRNLGWKPERDFDTALAATVGWYKQNEAWWKPLKRDAG